MTIVLDGTNGVTTPTLASSGPVTGTTASFSGDVTLGTSVLATPTGSAPSYTCRAWVNFNGTGTVAIRASGNVSSITDNGVGEYSVNFTNALPDANYAIALTAGYNIGTSGNTAINLNTDAGVIPTTTNFRVAVRNPSSGAFYDVSYVQASVFR